MIKWVHVASLFFFVWQNLFSLCIIGLCVGYHSIQITTLWCYILSCLSSDGATAQEMSLGGVLGSYLQTKMFDMKYYAKAENVTEKFLNFNWFFLNKMHMERNLLSSIFLGSFFILFQCCNWHFHPMHNPGSAKLQKCEIFVKEWFYLNAVRQLRTRPLSRCMVCQFSMASLKGQRFVKWLQWTVHEQIHEI